MATFGNFGPRQAAVNVGTPAPSSQHLDTDSVGEKQAVRTVAKTAPRSYDPVNYRHLPI